MCSRCSRSTTAVADLDGQELCLECWLKAVPPEARRMVHLDCPVTGARLDAVRAMGANVDDLRAWCAATRSLRRGSCWPECDDEHARLTGWLTASGRFRIPDGNQ